MRCPHCGREIAQDARFCLWCMTPLTNKETVPSLKPERRLSPFLLVAVCGLFAAGGIAFLVRGQAPALPPEDGTTFSAGTAGAADRESDPTGSPGTEPEGSETRPAVNGETTAPAESGQSSAPPQTQAPEGESPETLSVSGETACSVHMPVTDPAIPATCTQAGRTEGSHCSVCGKVLVAQTPLAATGHTPEPVPAVPATCTGTGLTEGSRCSVCGATLSAQEITAALGHLPVAHPFLAPTCKEPGYSAWSECSRCGAVLTARQRIDPSPHPAAALVVLSPIAPTCQHTGLTLGEYCSACGEVFIEQEILPVAEHDFSAATYQSPATCKWCGLTVGEKLQPPEISVEIGYPSFPIDLSGGTVWGVRVLGVRMESVFDEAEGSYTVIAHVTATGTYPAGVLTEIPGYLSGLRSDGGPQKWFEPGKETEAEVRFSHVPGGRYVFSF